MSSLKLNDTIVAISTASGDGAIGIIRISGRSIQSLLQKIFRPFSKKLTSNNLRLLPNYAYTGELILDNRAVDQVVIIYFKAPKSYTGEDMLEIHAHGGFRLLNLILKAMLKFNTRLALPGEFTRRAVFNGKIDLSRAEAVAEIMKAPSLQIAQAVTSQLGGKLYQKMQEIKTGLKTILALVNADIDFSDENIEFYSLGQVEKKLKTIKLTINRILSQAEESISLYQGYKLSINGSVNVGKSSLFNTLLSEEKSIVTDIAGTTRDIITSSLVLEGLKIELQDTAGLRETKDQVEKIGVYKATEAYQNANLILWMIDLSAPSFELPKKLLNLPDLKLIIVGNKLDLVEHNKIKLPIALAKFKFVKISTKKRQGLEELKHTITKNLNTNLKNTNTENAIIFNTRQQDCLAKAYINIQQAQALLKTNSASDIVAYELAKALESLSEVTGEVTTEELLDEIFYKFCIGK